MSRFANHVTAIEGVVVVERKPIGDERGFFERMFCASELGELGFSLSQMNRSFTQEKGAIRGMHYQNPPHAETKIISCLKGSVFDVAVDLRKGSPTFLHWHGEVLSAKNFRSMILPKGVAHGFQTLESDSELLYLHDAAYHPEAEGQLNVYEEKVGIDWPLPATTLSERDRAAPLLDAGFTGITV
ncbi:MAG: dTDP-4-dehydrorhamnose 3,5-epimerase family protein [Rhizobiaceae bacterium]|nr:dTDP-4-dehydrorhamnose 3,5-epimerase family protein [Rhizobiaceae bacterium]